MVIVACCTSISSLRWRSGRVCTCSFLSDVYTDFGLLFFFCIRNVYLLVAAVVVIWRSSYPVRLEDLRFWTGEGRLVLHTGRKKLGWVDESCVYLSVIGGVFLHACKRLRSSLFHMRRRRAHDRRVGATAAKEEKTVRPSSLFAEREETKDAEGHILHKYHGVSRVVSLPLNGSDFWMGHFVSALSPSSSSSSFMLSSTFTNHIFASSSPPSSSHFRPSSSYSKNW